MPQQAPIFNRQRLKQRRNRAAHRFEQYNYLKEFAAHNICERLDDMERTFDLALDISSCGFLPQLISPNKVQNWIQTDLSENILKQASGIRVVSDEEHLPFKAQSFDLISSTLSLHWVNQFQTMLQHIRRLLKPNGMFIANFFGPATLHELRNTLSESESAIRNGIALHICPFIDVKTAGMLLQHSGFELPITDSQTITITHEHVIHLHEDLKGMAENSAFMTPTLPLNQTILKNIDERYKKHYTSDDGGIYSTFEIVTMTGLAQQ